MGERRIRVDAVVFSRHAALWVMAVLVSVASLVSFAESYRGLYLWADHHGLGGVWAAAWPLQVDVFIAVGELALFVGLADRWPPRARMAAWVVTGAGLAVSVAGNVGHASSHALLTRVTWGVPPVAAAAALAVGMGVFKRVVAQRPAAPTWELAVSTIEDEAARAYASSVVGGNPLSDRALASRFGLSRRQAGNVIARMAAAGAPAPSVNGHRAD